MLISYIREREKMLLSNYTPFHYVACLHLPKVSCLGTFVSKSHLPKNKLLFILTKLSHRDLTSKDG